MAIPGAPQQVWGHSNSAGPVAGVGSQQSLEPTAGLSPLHRSGRTQHPVMPAQGRTTSPATGPCPTSPPQQPGQGVNSPPIPVPCACGLKDSSGDSSAPSISSFSLLAGSPGRFATWLFWKGDLHPLPVPGLHHRGDNCFGKRKKERGSKLSFPDSFSCLQSQGSHFQSAWAGLKGLQKCAPDLRLKQLWISSFIT